MLATDRLSILSRCAGQLFRITKARACFAYLVKDSTVSFSCEHGSQIEHMTDSLPQGLIEHIAELQRKVLSQEYTYRQDFVVYPDSDNPYGFEFKADYIKNLRVVPIADAQVTYAIVFLVNVVEEKLSADRLSLKPFIVATANLFSIKQARNFLPEHRSSLEKFSKSGVFEVMSHVYHPVILFNQKLVVTKFNQPSMFMIQQSSMAETFSVIDILKYFVPAWAEKIIQEIKYFIENNHFRQNKWKNIPLKLNAFQSIEVDIVLLVIKASNSINTAIPKSEQLLDFAIMINDNKRNELHSTQRFQALTSLIPLGILQLDANFHCAYANDTWSKISSLTLTTSLDDGWTKCFQSSDLHRVLPRMRALNLRNREFTEELQIVSYRNETKWIKLKSIGLFGDMGAIDGYIITVDDISQIKAKNSALRNLANTDSLTGLSNRACFHDRLKMVINRVDRHGAAAILYIDLDKFKAINDTYGHNVGDGVIQKVAHRLSNLIRKEDTIARLGGDEFAILVSDVKSNANVANLAAKIIIELTRPMQVERLTLNAQCSIGIEHIRESRATIKSVLRNADLAVYKAKSMGRNQFCVYSPSLEKETLLGNLLRSSLKTTGHITDFFLEYQPQVDATTNEIVGVEALSRWKHPTNEDIPPQEFIIQLELNGLINEFFVWQLSAILPLAKKWIKAGLINSKRRLSLNLSAVQLHVLTLSKDILNAFEQHRVDPKFFGLEVTETAFMEDPVGAGENLRILREAGFNIAIDDFGTGFSSLSLLRNMPLDGIKIDKEFIAEILSNPKDASIVKSMIALSQQLNLSVVAEGVENADVKHWLETHNCYMQQGFHFYKPMAPGQLEKCLTKVLTLH